jgi:hypothetical protein
VYAFRVRIGKYLSDASALRDDVFALVFNSALEYGNRELKNQEYFELNDLNQVRSQADKFFSGKNIYHKK